MSNPLTLFLHIQNNLDGLAREALDGASDTDMADGSFDTIQTQENEKEEVTDQNMSQVETDAETRKILRADDCEITQWQKLVPCTRLTLATVEAMKEIAFPPTIEQPRTLSDTVHTWEIKNWRSLSRREHGPVFDAGGFPW